MMSVPLNRQYKAGQYRKYLLPALLLLFALISVKLSRGIGPSSDWNVFYQAGINFSNKVSLYSRIGGAERYIYPPFAAMVFQVFHLLPFAVAAGIWIFLNWLIWLATLRVILQLLSMFGVEPKLAKFCLLCGAVLSFRYVWYHAMYVQMNLLMLFLSLAAILWFLQGRQWLAAACLCVAISIKVLPVIVLAWLITKGNYKFPLKALVVLLICTALPMVFRGFDMGIHDLREYYFSFIEPFKQGRVEPDFQNYGLSAAIYKIVVPSTIRDNPGQYQYNLFNATPETARLIYQVSMGILLLLFTTIVCYTRFIAKKINLYEISFILLLTHLLSGITWEYHLVSLLFVSTVFFLQVRRSNPRYVRVLHGVLITFMLLNAIIGKDTVGSYVYHLSCGYSFLTLLMLVLLIHSFKNVFSPQTPAVLLRQLPLSAGKAVTNMIEKTEIC